MNSLEDATLHRPMQLPWVIFSAYHFGFDTSQINIFGSDNNIYFLFFTETFIYTFKVLLTEMYQTVFYHGSIQ